MRPDAATFAWTVLALANALVSGVVMGLTAQGFGCRTHFFHRRRVFFSGWVPRVDPLVNLPHARCLHNSRQQNGQCRLHRPRQSPRKYML